MKIIYIILFSSFIFSMNKHLDTNFYAMVDTSVNSDRHISLKYPLYSAILPGLGEYKLYKETSISNHKIHEIIKSEMNIPDNSELEETLFDSKDALELGIKEAIFNVSIDDSNVSETENTNV